MRILIIFLLVSFYISSSALAESSIYTWKDEAGVTHYSSKATDRKARAAELPEIMKGEVKLVPDSFKVESCENRGGIDCRAGPDGDGSVICNDGFKDATIRYRFSCSSPKLSVAGVSERRADGSFTVTVRNSKPVVAKGVKVEFHAGQEDLIGLVGPPEIEPLGTGEYAYSRGRDPQALSARVEELVKPDPGKIDITCGNC